MTASRFGFDYSFLDLWSELDHRDHRQTALGLNPVLPSRAICGVSASASHLGFKAKTGRGSIYERLAELGHTITHVREEITARMPRPEEVAILAVPAGVPVIELLHTGIDQNGRAFECTRFVMRADRSALDYNISIEEPA